MILNCDKVHMTTWSHKRTEYMHSGLLGLDDEEERVMQELREIKGLNDPIEPQQGNSDTDPTTINRPTCPHGPDTDQQQGNLEAYAHTNRELSRARAKQFTGLRAHTVAGHGKTNTNAQSGIQVLTGPAGRFVDRGWHCDSTY